MGQHYFNRSQQMLVLAGLIVCLSTVGGEKKEAHARVDVSIANIQFKPALITIHTGDTVVWINNDDRDHTVVAADGSFKSGNIKANERFEFTFTLKGKYAYGCSYHPRMKGTVVVE